MMTPQAPLSLASRPQVVDYPTSDFLAQVFQTIKDFGGMPFTLKIAAIILLLIASLKVSIARPLWDRLGAYKALAAPTLSLIAGVLYLGVGPQPLTVPGLFAYLFAGSGAIILHELLDALKALPGVGGAYQGVIEFVQGFLKKQAPKVEEPKEPSV